MFPGLANIRRKSGMEPAVERSMGGEKGDQFR